VPNRENAAMNPVKAPGLKPTGDAAPPNPGRFELSNGHHPVLVRRQPRDRSVRAAVGRL
jgi:hypothetical protein